MQSCGFIHEAVSPYRGVLDHRSPLSGLIPILVFHGFFVTCQTKYICSSIALECVLQDPSDHLITLPLLGISFPFTKSNRYCSRARSREPFPSAMRRNNLMFPEFWIIYFWPQLS